MICIFMKSFWIATLLVLIFVLGCNTKQHKYTFVENSNAQIVNFITHTNQIKPIIYSYTSSEYYSLPTSDWVNNKFTPYYQNFLFKNNLRMYREGKNDCGKFTTHALSCAYVLFDSENVGNESSLAIGEFVYFTNLIKHSIIVFVVDDNGYRKLKFYEPQIQQFIELTDEQKKVCSNWRM